MALSSSVLHIGSNIWNKLFSPIYLHCGASPHSRCFVEHFCRLPSAVGLTLQLLCSPIGNRNFQNKTKHREWGDPPHCTYTVETAYKVAICPRGNLLCMRIYLIRSKVTMKKCIRALIYLLYKWFYFITGYFISGFYCTFLMSAALIKFAGILGKGSSSKACCCCGSTLTLTKALSMTGTLRTDCKDQVLK